VITVTFLLYILLLAKKVTIGLALNGFIVTVNLIWWWKSRTVQTVDLIILNLGLARLIHFIISSIYESPLFTNMTVHDLEYALAIFLCVVTCINNYSLWLGALLCVFYCVKLTNYSQRFFTYLKLNISKLVPGFLVASLATSFFCSLPFGWFVYDIKTFNSTNVTGGFYEQRIVLNYFNLLIIYIGGSALPLFLFCSAFSLLIRSLWSHSQQMKSVSCGFKPPQLDAHINAIKNMLAFIFLCLICFLSSTLFPLSLRSKNKVNFIIVSYPAFHSMVLIFGNSKLYKKVFKILLCFKMFFSSRTKPSDNSRFAPDLQI
uniref:Taste receptor type 2 n=1 Tax=Leptobrachium leishanense TaxID=445787 RepID=A0A8C5MFM4_9ANUR